MTIMDDKAKLISVLQAIHGYCEHHLAEAGAVVPLSINPVDLQGLLKDRADLGVVRNSNTELVNMLTTIRDTLQMPAGPLCNLPEWVTLKQAELVKIR